MTTAVVSDLHLGATAKPALMSEASVRRALMERLAGVDHVVLLGDTLELREASLGAAVQSAEPFFRELGQTVGSGRVTLIAGNHDHQLAAPLIEARQLTGADPVLDLDSTMPAPSTGPVGRFAEWLGETKLVLAYPGTWVRDDIYATHGHYLDCHNTVPSLERLAAAVTERVVGGLSAGRRTPDDYEAALAPIYSLSYSLAQAAPQARGLVGGGVSAAVWKAAAGNGRSALTGRALRSLVIPGAVAALNRSGLGRFHADLSGPELRRAGLRGMAAALDLLGIGAGHVLFGHTHRSGPWPDDDPAEWLLSSGGSMVNVGSWIFEPAFIGDRGADSPYWPGTVSIVEDAGPPRLERLLPHIVAS